MRVSVRQKVFFGLESEVGSALWKPDLTAENTEIRETIKVFDKGSVVDFVIDCSVRELSLKKEVDLSRVSFDGKNALSRQDSGGNINRLADRGGENGNNAVNH